MAPKSKTTTKKPAAKPATKAAPSKASKPKAKASAKPAAVKVASKVAPKPAVKPVSTPSKPVVVLKPIAGKSSSDALWVKNFKEFAAENPAMTVVGVVAVTLALILLLG